MARIVVQRCVVHKLRILERHVPRHAHDDLRANYHRIVYAESMALARQAYWAFLTTWEKRPPKVTASLREASDELLTFYRFPPASGRGCGPPILLNACYGEFRRRLKTQGALPTAQTDELLLFALLLAGFLRIRATTW